MHNFKIIFETPVLMTRTSDTLLRFRYLHNNELKEFKYGTFSNIPHLDRL
jgi:hypothetical protein